MRIDSRETIHDTDIKSVKSKGNMGIDIYINPNRTLSSSSSCNNHNFTNEVANMDKTTIIKEETM